MVSDGYVGVGALVRRVSVLGEYEEWDVPASPGIRGLVTTLSKGSRRRMAIAISGWLAGLEPEDVIQFATRTVRWRMGTRDPDWIHATDEEWAAFRVAVERQVKRWARAGWHGYWWVEIQTRGAPHLHAYLVGREGARPLTASDWLADVRVRSTGATHRGQHTEPARSTQALALYFIKESTKAVQKQGFRGRRWGRVNGPAVKAVTREESDLDIDHWPIWASYWDAVTRTDGDPDWRALARTAAGMVPRYWVGRPVTEPVPLLTEHEGHPAIIIRVRERYELEPGHWVTLPTQWRPYPFQINDFGLWVRGWGSTWDLVANLQAVDPVEQWIARTAIRNLLAWVREWQESGDAAWLVPLSLSLPHGRTRGSERTVSGAMAWDERVRRAKRSGGPTGGP